MLAHTTVLVQLLLSLTRSTNCVLYCVYTAAISVNELML